MTAATPRHLKRFAWVGVVLLIANEIRGIIFVVAFLKALLP